MAGPGIMGAILLRRRRLDLCHAHWRHQSAGSPASEGMCASALHCHYTTAASKGTYESLRVSFNKKAHKFVINVYQVRDYCAPVAQIECSTGVGLNWLRHYYCYQYHFIKYKRSCPIFFQVTVVTLNCNIVSSTQHKWPLTYKFNLHLLKSLNVSNPVFHCKMSLTSDTAETHLSTIADKEPYIPLEEHSSFPVSHHNVKCKTGKW